jgi:ankyrin repeat protein
VRQTTAAHIAARANNLQELRRVVEANEEFVNIQDANGWTPLIEAIRSKNLEMCDFLLKNGADVNARTIHKGGLGGSPLYWAFTFLNNDDPIISYLRNHGAKHYVPLKEEEVPLPVENQKEL